MFRMSDTARSLLPQSHTRYAKVEVLHAGIAVAELDVLSGSVGAQANRPILRNASLSLADPTGSLSRQDAGDLLNPYDAEVKVWLGLLLPSGSVEWVPYGVFRLTNMDIQDGDDGVSIKLTAQDRALIYQSFLPGPVTIAFGTPVEDAIQALLSRVFGGLSWRPWLTGQTVGPLLYESDTQAWKAGWTLAESVGGWLFHDRDGVCCLAPYAATNSPTLQRLTETGTLLSVSRGEDADEIHNSVVMQSADTGAGVIRVTAEDTDPTSPTYVNGGFGRRQVTVTNEHLSTVSQAQLAATARLVQELGRSETVSGTIVTDPQLDVGDAVTVHAPSVGVVEGRLVIESLNLNLDVGSAQTFTVRRSVVSTTGSALPVLL